MMVDGDASQAVSELVWYTRLAVWVGCGVLLIEAAFGRSTGPLTALAVMLIIVGFLGFLGGLLVESGSLNWMSSLAESPEAVEGIRVTSTVPAPEEPRARDDDVIYPDAVKPEEAAQSPALVASSDTTAAPRSVETLEVGTESPLTGASCAHCGKALEQGDIAATCWRCGAPHHAACWVGNRFHCSKPECDGAGSLEALASP